MKREKILLEALKKARFDLILLGARQEAPMIRDIDEAIEKAIKCNNLPESDEIRDQALQMDEKEFDQWWWEKVYKK